MIKDRYIKAIRQIINTQNPQGKLFIYGSSLQKNNFNGIDIGLIDGKNEDIYKLKEKFEESTLPYKIDLIDFNQVDENFKKEVFKK